MSEEGLDLSADEIPSKEAKPKEGILGHRLGEEDSRIRLRRVLSYGTAFVAVALFGVSVSLAYIKDSNPYVIGIFVASATFLNLKVLGTALPGKESKEPSGHPLLNAVIRVLDALKDYMNKKQP